MPKTAQNNLGPIHWGQPEIFTGIFGTFTLAQSFCGHCNAKRQHFWPFPSRWANILYFHIKMASKVVQYNNVGCFWPNIQKFGSYVTRLGNYLYVERSRKLRQKQKEQCSFFWLSSKVVQFSIVLFLRGSKFAFHSFTLEVWPKCSFGPLL